MVLKISGVNFLFFSVLLYLLHFTLLRNSKRYINYLYVEPYITINYKINIMKIYD